MKGLMREKWPSARSKMWSTVNPSSALSPVVGRWHHANTMPQGVGPSMCGAGSAAGMFPSAVLETGRLQHRQAPTKRQAPTIIESD